MRYSGLLLALSSLLIVSCSEGTGVVNGKFELLSKSVQQGKQTVFRFTLDEDDKELVADQGVFAEIQFYSSMDGVPRKDTTVKLSQNLEGQIIVPSDAAALTISLATSSEVLDGYSSGIMAIERPGGELVRKARTYLLWSGVQTRNASGEILQRTEYDNMFAEERRFYPDDLAIFAARWLYTRRRGVVDTMGLIKAMEALERLPSGPYRDALQFMGSSLLASKGDPIPSVISNREGNPAFDDPIFVNWLLMMRGPGYVQTTEWKNEIEMIMSANPTSLYTELLLLAGTYKSIAPAVSLRAAERMMQRDRRPLHLYYKMKILSLFYPQRREECRDIVTELKAEVEKGNYYAEGRDPSHWFNHYMAEPFLVDATLLSEQKLFDDAISVLRHARTLVHDPWHRSHALILSLYSDVYFQKGFLDSSTAYMVAAARHAPGVSFIHDTLRARYGRSNSSASFNSWIQGIERSLPADAHVPLPRSLSHLHLESGEKVRFDGLGDAVVVLEFWATGCTFCTDNIRHAAEYAARRKPTDVKIFVVSSDLGSVRQRLKSMNISLPLLLNSRDFVRAFRVSSYPVTIVIRNNRIVGRYAGACKVEEVLARIQ